MIYLIGVLAPWLMLTAALAGLAGWAIAAERATPALVAQRRERDKLVRDLALLAAGEATPQTALVSDADAARGLVAVRDGRIAELERALEQARSRAAELAGEAAELQRRSERFADHSEELARLREQVAAHERQTAQTIDAQVEPALALPAAAPPPEEETNALQTWRLRYFEQRVKFLEGRAASSEHGAAPDDPSLALAEWRAREADARAHFLEQELRRREGSERPAADVASPFAANPEVDVLLRWRMLYLERRLAYLQQAAVHAPLAPAETVAADSAPDPDRWRWRARYLEARVRHLEERQTAPQAPQLRANGGEQHDVTPAPTAAAVQGERPLSLPAANAGAPDDFTLIEGVSALQQSTLNSLGIYHFDQIAAWTPANVAWVDRYLRLRGRITDEEWVEQAAELAQFGVPAARPHSDGARA